MLNQFTRRLIRAALLLSFALAGCETSSGAGDATPALDAMTSRDAAAPDAAPSTDAAEVSDAAPSTDAAEASDGAPSMDAAEASDGAPSTDAAEASDGAPSTDAAEASDAAPSADAAEASDGAPSTDAAEASDAAPSADAAEASDGAPSADAAPDAGEASDAGAANLDAEPQLDAATSDGGCPTYDGGVPICMEPAACGAVCPVLGPPPLVGAYDAWTRTRADGVSGDLVIGCTPFSTSASFHSTLSVRWDSLASWYTVAAAPSLGLSSLFIDTANQAQCSLPLHASDTVPEARPPFCNLPDPVGGTIPSSADFTFESGGRLLLQASCSHLVLGGCGDDLETITATATFRCLPSTTVCWNGDLVTCDATGTVTQRIACGAPCISL